MEGTPFTTKSAERPSWMKTLPAGTRLASPSNHASPEPGGGATTTTTTTTTSTTTASTNLPQPPPQCAEEEEVKFTHTGAHHICVLIDCSSEMFLPLETEEQKAQTQTQVSKYKYICEERQRNSLSALHH